MRAVLYRNLEQGFVASELTDLHGQVNQADLFAPLIAEVQRTHRELQKTINSGSDSAAGSETFDAIPLLGGKVICLAYCWWGAHARTWSRC